MLRLHEIALGNQRCVIRIDELLLVPIAFELQCFGYPWKHRSF